MMIAAEAGGQERSIAVTGERLTGIVLPIEPLSADIELFASRARAWTVDDTQRLLLQSDVVARINGYEFAATQATVWINRLPSDSGTINQIAVFFDAVTNPANRAGLGIAGRDLLVTGSARGEVRLKATVMEEGRPRATPFLARAHERLAAHLEALLVSRPTLANRPQVEEPPKREPFVPRPGGRVEATDVTPPRIELPPLEGDRPWLFEPEGMVRVLADPTTTVRVLPEAEETRIVILGPTTIEYADEPRAGMPAQLSISAQRAVIYADPGEIRSMEFSAGSIRGIYLEGAVRATADAGRYTVRAPQAYYDFRTRKAVMVDALLRTYLEEDEIPVAARAGELRQVATNQWQGENVLVSTSDFFTPHLAIGARRVTVTQPRRRADSGGARQTQIDASDASLRVAGLPVVVWPRFSGTPSDVPLRSVEVGTRDNDGVRIETRWDAYALLGIDRPSGTDWELKADGFTKRGAALGTLFRYDVTQADGLFDLYGMYDDGIDRTSAGREVPHEDEFRGLALWEHQQQLSQYWSFQGQFSLISDASFVSTWREDDFANRREYETSGYLKHQKDTAAFTVLAKTTLDDFLSNSYLLASRQYTVDKLPELGYRRYADSWFDGAVTWSSETRASRMRLVFDRSTPDELGVPGRAFGFDDDDQLSDALRAEGYSTSYVSRFDTRHEFAMPFQAGAAKVAPFIVARGTAYDDDFESYSSDSDALRLYGAAGVRASAQFQRVDNGVENRLLDLHRLRHIAEPYATLWYGYGTVSEEDLPEYNASVESIGAGGAVQLGLRNTIQSQRGGPGRWRSVDVLTLDASVVVNTDDVNRESPSPQFFEYRPEYSQFGDHVDASMIWLISDALSLTGQTIYDIDSSDFARGSIGAEVRHSPLLTTFVEYRTIEASANEILGIGWNYQLTPKYHIALRPQWDFVEDEFRSLTARVTRSFPEFEFTFEVKHDEIKGDTTFSAALGRAEF
jgi:hypothetical protein